MTESDDPEFEGGLWGGEIRNSFDRRFVMLHRQALAQGLVLFRDGENGPFYLEDPKDEDEDEDDFTVYRTERQGLDGLEDIGSWLIANREPPPPL